MAPARVCSPRALALVFICVGVHYEGLSLASTLVRRLPIAHRARVVVGLIAALFAHIFEVLIFGVGWYVLDIFGFVHVFRDDPLLG